jgi:hypothetical protein
MYSIGFALIPLGLMTFVGAILGRGHRSVSLGMLVAAGLLMFLMGVSFLIVGWRDPELTISPAIYLVACPGRPDRPFCGLSIPS